MLTLHRRPNMMMNIPTSSVQPLGRWTLNVKHPPPQAKSQFAQRSARLQLHLVRAHPFLNGSIVQLCEMPRSYCAAQLCSIVTPEIIITAHRLACMHEQLPVRALACRTSYMFRVWILACFSCGHSALYGAQHGGYMSRSTVLSSTFFVAMSHCP